MNLPKLAEGRTERRGWAGRRSRKTEKTGKTPKFLERKLKTGATREAGARWKRSGY